MLQTVRNVRKLTQKYTEIKFYCTSKNNGDNKILFGLTSLLKTSSSYGQKTNDYRKIFFGLGNLAPLSPKIKEKFARYIILNTPNFFKENQTRNKGRSIALTAIALASGVTLFCANYISSLDKQKTLPSSNYSIKDKIVVFIYGPIEPPQNKGFLKTCVSATGVFLKSATVGTSNVICYTFSCVTKPVMHLFKPPEKKSFWGHVKDYTPDTLLSIGKGVVHIVAVTYNGIKYPVVKLFYGSESRDEKLGVLVGSLYTIDYIYNMMKTLGTGTAQQILTCYSDNTRHLHRLITQLLKEDGYSRVTTILASVTVVSIQLILIAYFNVPFTEQLSNIAFSVFNGTYPLSKDPLFEEMSVYLKKELKKNLGI